MISSVERPLLDGDLLGHAVQCFAMDIVYIVDKAGNIQCANNRFWTEIGLAAEEAGPAAMLKVLAEDCRLSALRSWNTILLNRKSMRSVLFLVNTRGEKRVISVQESPVVSANVATCVLGVGRDITEEYNVEGKIWSTLENRNAALEYSVRASLGLVKGYAYTLHKIENMTAEKRERFCRVIAEEVDSMGRSIDNLLLGRGTGDVEREAELFNLSEVVADAVLSYKSEAARRSIELHFLESSSDVRLFGQPVALSRIVGNLIEFCLMRVTHSGMIKLDINDSEEYVELHIVDNGPSITNEQIDWLMSGAREVDSKGIVVSGSKFDLDVANLLARSLGGGILASSGENGGLGFTVMLPRTAHAFCNDSNCSESLSI